MKLTNKPYRLGIRSVIKDKNSGKEKEYCGKRTQAQLQKHFNFYQLYLTFIQDGCGSSKWH